MPVITAENLDDTLVPKAISSDTPNAISNAPQSKSIDPNFVVPPANPNTVPR